MDMFWSLAGEVGKLFLMMLIGFVVYRLGIITVEESKILSKMMLYIVLPAVVLHSFMVEFTPDKTRGLLLSYAAALGVSLVLVAAVTLLKRPLHLTPVDVGHLFQHRHRRADCGRRDRPGVGGVCHGDDLRAYVPGVDAL